VAQRDAAKVAQQWVYSRERERCAELAERLVSGFQSIASVNIDMNVLSMRGR
jgi:hypothetical protein